MTRLTFSLTDKQEAKISKWLKDLPEAFDGGGAIGGRLVYTFCPTSIGLVVRARDDISGKEIDLTEYENW